MDSDFSKASVGDWAWTVSDGWERITEMGIYGLPVSIGDNAYTMDGKYSSGDKFPSAFIVPPTDFNAGSPPCEFEEGDKMLVWNDEHNKYRAYFSHFGESDGKYYCFYQGDEWMSSGDTIGWKHCERWKE